MVYSSEYYQTQLEKRDPVTIGVALAAGLGSGLSITAAGAIAFNLTLGGFLLAAGSSLVLSGISMLMAPDAPQSDFGSFASIRSQGITRQIRQPVTERRIVYGEARTSGPTAFIASSGDNEYLHMVIMLASHEVQEIGEVIVNEESITDDMLDGDNIVNSGRYSGLIRIKKFLGTTEQTADADLVAEVAEWTTAHRLQEIAGIYVRVKWDREKFPSGLPNFSAWIKGKKVLDTRDQTERWTPNLTLIARDYLTDTKLGLQTAAADIANEDEITDADDSPILDADGGVITSVGNGTGINPDANICEEYVTTQEIAHNIISADSATDIITLDDNNDSGLLEFCTADKLNLSGSSLPGGLAAGTDYYVGVYQRQGTPRIKLYTSFADCIAGTNAVNITSSGTGSARKIAEPRYLGGGLLKTSAERGKNLEEILASMAGQAVYAGGAWRILAGYYRTPTVYLDESDVAGPLKVQTKASRRDRFNLVQGVYTSPLNAGNPSDYPAVENSTYRAADGGDVLRRNFDQPFTQRPQHAKRVAKIDLERSRQEIVFTADFKLTAFKLQVGDNFYFSFARYGWTEKIFEVIDWTLNMDSTGRPVVNLRCRENASAVYDWNSGEETAVDPAPNTTLPDPFTVDVVTGFSLDSVVVLTEAEDLTFKVLASWEPHPNQFVASGGAFEVMFKKSNEPDDAYRSLAKVDGSITSVELPQLEPDTLFDIQIIAYNQLGVPSDPTTITDFTVGTTVTTNTEDWENLTEARNPDDWETDSEASEDFNT